MVSKREKFYFQVPRDPLSNKPLFITFHIKDIGYRKCVRRLRNYSYLSPFPVLIRSTPYIVDPRELRSTQACRPILQFTPSYPCLQRTYLRCTRMLRVDRNNRVSVQRIENFSAQMSNSATNGASSVLLSLEP